MCTILALAKNVQLDIITRYANITIIKTPNLKLLVLKAWWILFVNSSLWNYRNSLGASFPFD